MKNAISILNLKFIKTMVGGSLDGERKELTEN